ncbi:MAG: thioesterase family protein [Nocardioidaceae bacterium]|nr:thioesterase family protein [Nocardioidaceae bacterium]
MTGVRTPGAFPCYCAGPASGRMLGVTYLLDDAVATTPAGPGHHLVQMSAQWNTANQTPNGGYILALLLQAVLAESRHPDALTLAVTYFRPSLPGPAEITVRELRSGRRVSSYDAVLRQGEKEVAHAVISTHDWNAVSGRTHTPHAAPDAPPPEKCLDLGEQFPVGLVPILDRYDYRAPTVPGWLEGKPSGITEGLCWIRSKDQRPLDTLLAGAMVDAFPPVIVELGTMASATIQLTVHFRARPATDTSWALGHVVTRHLIDGYHDETVELWGTDGRLIAQSHQLAILTE